MSVAFKILQRTHMSVAFKIHHIYMHEAYKRLEIGLLQAVIQVFHSGPLSCCWAMQVTPGPSYSVSPSSASLTSE